MIAARMWTQLLLAAWCEYCTFKNKLFPAFSPNCRPVATYGCVLQRSSHRLVVNATLALLLPVNRRDVNDIAAFLCFHYLLFFSTEARRGKFWMKVPRWDCKAGGGGSLWGRPGYRIWDLLIFITRQTAACSGQSWAGRTASLTEEDAEF